MTSLFRYSRRIVVALAIALGLIIVSSVVTPLIGSELAEWGVGAVEVYAGWPEHGCC